MDLQLDKLVSLILFLTLAGEVCQSQKTSSEHGFEPLSEEIYSKADALVSDKKNGGSVSPLTPLPLLADEQVKPVTTSQKNQPTKLTPEQIKSLNQLLPDVDFASLIHTKDSNHEKNKPRDGHSDDGKGKKQDKHRRKKHKSRKHRHYKHHFEPNNGMKSGSDEGWVYYYDDGNNNDKSHSGENSDSSDSGSSAKSYDVELGGDNEYEYVEDPSGEEQGTDGEEDGTPDDLSYGPDLSYAYPEPDRLGYADEGRGDYQSAEYDDGDGENIPGLKDLPKKLDCYDDCDYYYHNANGQDNRQLRRHRKNRHCDCSGGGSYYYHQDFEGDDHHFRGHVQRRNCDCSGGSYYFNDQLAAKKDKVGDKKGDDDDDKGDDDKGDDGKKDGDSEDDDEDSGSSEDSEDSEDSQDSEDSGDSDDDSGSSGSDDDKQSDDDSK